MIGVVLNASLNVLLVCNMRYCLLIISLASFKVKTKTKWTQKLTHDIIKTFTDLSQHDINKIKTEKVRNPKSNIWNGDPEAIKHLAKWRDIFITTAEKGVVVVIMETEN